MKTTKLILQTMRELGADVFWNMPGRAVYPLLNELPGINGLRHITALHESSLTNAADGYARATGRPAWVNLYYSTGLMNGLNGIFMAYRDHVPLVVTATQTESDSVGANNRAECEDVLGLVRPVTKWAAQPTRADRVQEALVRAWSIASTPPMGPCFVALPVDFWNEDVPYEPVPATVLEPAGAGDVSFPVKMLAAAEAPVIVIGAEAVRSGALELVESLADDLRAPLFAEPDSSYPAGYRAELFGGAAGLHKKVVAEADLVLYVNVSTLERADKALFTAGRPKRHLQIASDEIRINEHVSADWVTFAHPVPTLRAIREQLSQARLDAGALKARGEAMSAHLARWRSDIDAVAKEVWDLEPMSTVRFYSELRKAVPEDAIMVEHATTSARVFGQHFRVPTPYNHLAASGSNQGWGIAASLGVKAANPDKPVFAVVGDGGFMFNAPALVTAVSHDLPVIAVVMNNGGWGSMRRSVQRGAPAVLEHGLDLKFGWDVDFETFGKAIGAEAATVHRPEEVAPVVERALASGRTFIINAKVSTPTKADQWG